MMIFVTVGTHEQPFDRLIKEMDRLKGEGLIREDVLMQTGFGTYEPKHCKWKGFLPYRDMEACIRDADMVITHGGPASFIAPLQIGKIPIVVPRQKRYGEHINDHQVDFCRKVEERMGNIIVVEDIGKLSEAIGRYGEYCGERQGEVISHNRAFNERLEALVKEIFES